MQRRSYVEFGVRFLGNVNLVYTTNDAIAEHLITVTS